MIHSSTKKRGFSLIEATIAVGVFGVTLLTLGNFMAATDRLSRAAVSRDAALGYAREALEARLVSVPIDYHCKCGENGSCNPTQCTRTADGKKCNLASGRNTCWVELPGGLTTTTDTPDPLYQRTLTLVDVPRTPADISPGNTKRATSTVTWIEHGQSKSVSLGLTLTAWKD